MEKENKKTIAVLLTVHNRKDTTLCCLEKLFANNLPSNVCLNVYLVDDGCTDGTSEAVSSAFPKVNLIKGNGNLYWNRGMWTAWEEAAKNDFDYYVWLNDDTNLYPYAISTLLEASEAQNDVTIIVGATESSNHSIITYGGRNDGKIPVPNGMLAEVSYFNGNIVLVPSYVYHKLGNLDPYFTHSKGDFDYGLRAKKKGVRIYQAGKILGVCDSHPTIDKWCNPNVKFVERWRALWKPNGMPPHETFHLDRKHKGLIIACIHYVSTISRCCIPILWSKRNK